jgi:acyl carrier protein
MRENWNKVLGVTMNTLVEIQNIFREIFDNDTLRITMETSIDDIAEWDSIAQVKLVLTIEERFGFQFNEDEMSSIRNVGGFVNAVECRRNPAG